MKLYTYNKLFTSNIFNGKSFFTHPLVHLFNKLILESIAVIAVESAVKYSLVLQGMQTRRKGQYNVELTLSLCLCVRPLITEIKVI